MITWQIRFKRRGERFSWYFEAEEGLEHCAAENEARYVKADLAERVLVVEYDKKTEKKKRGGREFWLKLEARRYKAEQKRLFVEGVAGEELKKDQLVQQGEDGKFYGVK